MTFHLDSDTFSKWQAASGDVSIRGKVMATGGILSVTVTKQITVK